MLEISSNDFIYITKGDTGVFTVKLTQGYDPNNEDKLRFYVRNARNLDNVIFALGETENGAGDTIPEGNFSDAGYIKKVIENNSWREGEWEIHIAPEATAGSAALSEMKRTKYVYDIKLIKNDNSVITFVGGGADKLNFVVT